MFRPFQPRNALAALATTTLVAALAGCSDSRSATPPRAAPAAPSPSSTAAAPATPIEVGIVAVQPESLTLRTELAGRTRAALVAEIRPQVGGIVRARPYTEGAMVRAGQVLYEIDAASYRAAHANATAAVARAEATVDAARLTAARRAELARIDAVSQQDVQDAQATLKQAEADLAAARAAQDTARLALERTRITSPISGRADVSTVTPGALVTADQATALTTVRQVDPIQVEVTQSSAEWLRLQRELAAGDLQRTGRSARVTLRLEDGSDYAHVGRMKLAGVSVNTGTGSVTLRAEFPNPEGLLLPGMYVRAALPSGVATDALLVPQQAVSRDAGGGASVLVVDAADRVQRRAITTDRAVGNRWLVSAGLAAGEQVIVEGAQKVKPGDSVRPQAVALSPAAPPAPAASSPTPQAAPRLAVR